MEQNEFSEMLEQYRQKLNQSEQLFAASNKLNRETFELIQKEKSERKLKSLVSFKTITILLGLLWVGFLMYLVAHSWSYEKLFFLISALGIVIITTIAIAVYIYHIVLIKKVDSGNPVIFTQQILTKLKFSTLQITRILFLQSVFYCTFWWNFEMIDSDPIKFWLISFPIALIFLMGSLWLFKNISIKNTGKKWFKILFNSPEWNRLNAAAAYLQETSDFAKE